MNVVLLRRRKLGHGSCTSIRDNLHTIFNRDIWTGRMDQNPPTADILIRWGCTDTGISQRSIENKLIVINPAEKIHLVNDKAKCRRLLQDKFLSVPKSHFRNGDVIDTLGTNNIRELHYPLIGRKQFHHQGRQLKIINNERELMADNQSAYWSEFIDKQKEYRVFVFFGRVTMVAEKVFRGNRNAVAWNVAQGTVSFVNVPWNAWPLEVCKEALKAQKITGIDFAGVDVMVKDEKPYILELNSAHSLTSPYRQKTFAKALEWAIKEIETNHMKPAHFEIPNRITPKKIILPFIRENRENDI